MALNKIVKRRKVGDVTNAYGDKNYSINDPFTRLRVAATSCLFGEPSYYIQGDSDSKRRQAQDYASRYAYSQAVDYEQLVPNSWYKMNTREMMESAIDAALNEDIERTLQFADELRNQYYFRATPQVIMVRAAMHPNAVGNGLIRWYAPKIMSRLDEVMNQMAYFAETYGGGAIRGVPSRLKRAWQRRLEMANDYEAAKYKLTGRNVNIFDAVNITHANTPVIDKLMKGNLSLGSGAEGKTWESIISGGGSWEDAVEVMGHMALLRNLRNLHKNKALTPNVLHKLKEGVIGGKQFPFRYFSAYDACKQAGAGGKVLDAIEDCLEISLGNLPELQGRTLIACDVSGSMSNGLSAMSHRSMRDIAYLMAAITAKIAEGGGDVALFGQYAKFVETRQKSTIFDIMEGLQRDSRGCGHSTELHKVWSEIIANKWVYDTIFVYSDMQCGHTNEWGGIGDTAGFLKKYKREVNPNVNFFSVNLAGHRDALVPEMYKGAYLLGGWSDQILRFAAEIINVVRAT